MNQTNYKLDGVEIEVTKALMTTGEMALENGGTLPWKSVKIMFKVNGQKMTAKLDKAYVEVWEDEVPKEVVF